MNVRERGAKAVLKQANLTYNLNQFRKLHPGPITAVVKADAYGHGLEHVIPALNSVDAFAVATIEEALELRALTSKHRIILLEGVFNDEELAVALTQQFDLVVHQEYQIAMVMALPDTKSLNVWLKVDTGMGRLGFTPSQAKHHIKRMMTRAQLSLHLMSHMAQSDQPLAIQTQQQQKHNEWIKSLGLPYSFSNTAAVLNRLSDANEWVRIGIGLFGVSPLVGTSGQDFGLKPVMQLQSKIIATKVVDKGCGIGYGAQYVTTREQRIGVVGIGYADGYPWFKKASLQARIAGHYCDVLGRVSMDMLVVDLSEVPEIEAGEDVVLWGEELPVENLAMALDMIPYVLICGISKRVKYRVNQ